jgi:hypothetical protein
MKINEKQGSWSTCVIQHIHCLLYSNWVAAYHVEAYEYSLCVGLSNWHADSQPCVLQILKSQRPFHTVRE